MKILSRHLHQDMINPHKQAVYADLFLFIPEKSPNYSSFNIISSSTATALSSSRGYKCEYVFQVISTSE
nr:MAG TPA: hypothetical protein [Caudoviricetes sp.]